MSIDQETQYIHTQPAGLSPLFHPPLALNHSRFNPNHRKPNLLTRMEQSPNIHSSSSSEPSSAHHFTPLRSINRNRRHEEPKSSFLLTNQFKNNLEAKLQEIVSPSALEPESSSSQPSEPVSGTRRDTSPLISSEKQLKKAKTMNDMFTEDFYRRVNDFFDNEGLDLADPVDDIQGIRMFSKLQMLEEEEGPQNTEMHDRKGVQSANHSPKLIADNLFSSTLLQRRSCRSQGPKGAMISLNTLEKPKGRLNLGVFRHFKDDLNQIMQTASPIEEKMTPVISRNNSGFVENTPDRMISKKFSFKNLKSPEPREGNGLNRLSKYTIKSTKSFKSPYQSKINKIESVNEISPLKSSKDRDGSSSLCSSPVMIIPSSSPQKEMQLETPVRSSRSNNGKVMRKSRFQVLRDLQECPPMN